MVEANLEEAVFSGDIVPVDHLEAVEVSNVAEVELSLAADRLDCR